MNQVRALQIALVVVILAAAIFGGYASYRLDKLNRQVYNFANNIAQVKNDAEAKTAIADFLYPIVGQQQVATSASANIFSKMWHFLSGSGGRSGGSSSGGCITDPNSPDGADCMQSAGNPYNPEDYWQ